MKKNWRKSYSLPEMISIVLFFPFSLMIGLNPLAEFWDLDAGNYRRKIWQRIILIIISLFLWFQLLWLML